MKGRRAYTRVPAGLEKIFAVINPYREENTALYYNDDPMYIQLKKGWILAMSVEQQNLKVQMWRDGESNGYVETIPIERWGDMQTYLSAVL